MMPGKKVMAIYGFCDIRQFTDSTEALQESVMIFVNEIARIVHGVTNEYLGMPNKNIGDAFLLVWKIPESEVFLDFNGAPQIAAESAVVNNIADASLIAILKIIAKVNREPKVLNYRHNEAVKKRIKNY